MEHGDAESLALLALGETVDDAVRAHVEACERCSEEVAELAAVVAVGRGALDETLVAPGAQVWERIGAELGLGGAVPRAEGPTGVGPATAPGTTPTAMPTATPTASPTAPEPDPGLATVTPLRPRRTGWLVAAAAAAGLVVGAGGVQLLSGDDADPGAAVVAQAALDPLPGWDASGQAVVEQADDGALTLVLTLDGASGDGGFREVWLIDREVTRLISVGVLEGSQGRFTLPAGVDLADFAVVDVSAEPFDGDPAHSGDSIIRGTLDA